MEKLKSSKGDFEGITLEGIGDRSFLHRIDSPELKHPKICECKITEISVNKKFVCLNVLCEAFHIWIKTEDLKVLDFLKD